MNKETITTPQMELLIYDYFEKSSFVIVPKFSRLNAVRYDDDSNRGYRVENIVTHECDTLSVTKNYFLREIEIKVSVSDFKADFNKKHNHEGNIKQFYYAGILVAVYENEHWQLKRYKKAIDNKSATPIDEEKLNKIFRIGYLKYWFYRKREK